MTSHADGVADRDVALYRATLDQAVQSAAVIMGRVLVCARQSLAERLTQAVGVEALNHLTLSLSLLERHASLVSERYPQALAAVFQQAVPTPSGAGGALKNLRFDQLELMDSAQVHERVALARVQQSVQLVVDTALTEFNTYICSALGMTTVQPERNPLRPELFVHALQHVLAQTHTPVEIQVEWLQHMGASLGHELSLLYTGLSAQLQAKGVAAAGYAVARAPERSSSSRLPDGVPPSSNESVLTLDRLRCLLAGELAPAPVDSRLTSFAAQFAREFETGRDELPRADFASTVPAAFEALQEMQQVDRVMERIGQRHHAVHAQEAASPASLPQVRDQLRRTASGLGQMLSLEVVALMVENIVQDVRLLAPIKQMVSALEPALLRLVLVDPRFFSDKQHPARQVLLDITHRSLAYDSVVSRGFAEFLAPLQEAVRRFVDVPIEDAQPFEQLRQTLVSRWDAHQAHQPLAQAVQALQQAEQRHLLAAKIANEFQARPDAAHVPAGVLDFLSGPWSQVVAHAQLAHPVGADDPGRYRELVMALLWSAKPVLTSKNITKLTRLVPKLLGKLREGLQLIDYPPLKTSEFFELLMNLHQQAFRPAATAPASDKLASLPSSLLMDTGPWLAPAEAKASGFMVLSDDVPQQEAPHAPVELLPLLDSPVVPAAEFSLPVSAWVEMLINGVWVRAQLAWASPHGTLFLFTTAYGSTQSMTRRSRDILMANGSMRLVSDQPVVDGALDAVVQSAMLNSLDQRL